DEIKRLYERFGDQLTVYPQFSQFAVKGDPRRHRVVHLNYRVGKRDLSYPRPQVDLTTREGSVPAPEAEPKAPAPRRNGNNEAGDPAHPPPPLSTSNRRAAGARVPPAGRPPGLRAAVLPPAGSGRPALAGSHGRVPRQRVGRVRAPQGDRVE